MALPIVEIIWQDFEVIEGWHEPEEIDSVLRERADFTSVGYRVGQDEEFLLLASSTSQDGCAADIMKIPMGQVKQMILLDDGVENESTDS
jgi:hypothetical protein